MSDNTVPALEAIAVLDRDEAVSETPSSSENTSQGKSSASSQTRWRTARRVGWLLRPFRGTVSLLLVLSLVAVAIDVVPPMLQGLLVDHVLRVEPNVSGSGKLLILLAGIVSGLLAIRVAATVVNVMKGKVSSRVGTTLTAYLRNALVERLSFLPLAYHNRNQVGALMSRVAYDTETLHTLVYHITSGLLLQSLQLVGIGMMLFYLNPKLAVVTLLPMPLIAAGSWYFTRYLQPRYNHYWDAVGKQAGGLTGMLTGIRVVKTFAQEEREIDRFGRASRHLCESRQSVDGSISTFSSLMGFVFASGGLAVWYIGGRDVLFGQMTLGALMAFLAYLAMFYAPLTSISESMSWFGSFFATIDRIFDLLETPIEGQGKRRGRGRKGEGEREIKRKLILGLHLSPSPVSHPSTDRGGVEFRNVNFAYDKNKPVLKDVNFAVQPGEMVGIVGRSGSGKSTLVSLMSRLYEVDSGQVLVGGVDAATVEPRELPAHWHGAAGAVPVPGQRLGKHHLRQPFRRSRRGFDRRTASRCSRLYHAAALRLRKSPGRRRRGPFRRRAAAALHRQGAARRSGYSHSRRGDGKHRRRVGASDLRGHPPLFETADDDRHRPPAFDASQRRPPLGLRPGPARRAGHARGIDGLGRALQFARPFAIQQRPGRGSG